MPLVTVPRPSPVLNAIFSGLVYVIHNDYCDYAGEDMTNQEVYHGVDKEAKPCTLKKEFKYKYAMPNVSR